MLEAKMDLWDPLWDIRCITTNGYVKSNGACVMGRGVALQAKNKYPGIATDLGRLIKLHGNHVFLLYAYDIVSFPVKNNWYEKGDLELIKRSAEELMSLLEVTPEIKQVALPRPGCGNGKLSWEVVKPKIENILDDRVTIVYQ